MLRRNQVARLLVVVFLIVGLAPLTLSQDTSDVSYHISASEVRLVFFATDEHNRAVQNLQQDDFAVIDNEKVIRHFRSFSRSASTKLDVIVLFDASESVLPHFKQEMSAVLQLISQWPGSPQDNVSVLSFSGTEAHSACAGDCRSSFTADRIGSLPTGGTTPLFDALDTATSLLGKRRQPEVWPVIILFSDGDDTISKDSFHRALQKILASETQVYAVDVGSPGQSSNGAAILQKIASDSGGRYIQASKNIVGIVGSIIDDLRSARVITYALPESGSDFHSVRILPTHNLSLRFRSRRGYYRSGTPLEDNR